MINTNTSSLKTNTGAKIHSINDHTDQEFKKFGEQTIATTTIGSPDKQTRIVPKKHPSLLLVTDCRTSEHQPGQEGKPAAKQGLKAMMFFEKTRLTLNKLGTGKNTLTSLHNTQKKAGDDGEACQRVFLDKPAPAAPGFLEYATLSSDSTDEEEESLSGPSILEGSCDEPKQVAKEGEALDEISILDGFSLLKEHSKNDWRWQINQVNQDLDIFESISVNSCFQRVETQHSEQQKVMLAKVLLNDRKNVLNRFMDRQSLWMRLEEVEGILSALRHGGAINPSDSSRGSERVYSFDDMEIGRVSSNKNNKKTQLLNKREKGRGEDPLKFDLKVLLEKELFGL